MNNNIIDLKDLQKPKYQNERNLINLTKKDQTNLFSFW